MSTYTVAEEGEIAPGERIIVQIEGKEIAVFRDDDGETYHAYLNWCPHQGGPVCEGELTGTCEAHFDEEELTTTEKWVYEDEILVCPWHGWEFDINTGDSLSREGIKLPTFNIEVEAGDIVLSLG